MKTYRVDYCFKEGDLTRTQAKRYDEQHPELRRLTGMELDALTRLAAGSYLIDSAIEDLDGFIKERGYTYVAALRGNVAKLLTKLTTGISVAQKQTLMANANTSSITLSSGHVAGYTNLNQEDVRQLVGAVTGCYCALHCMLSKGEARRCGIRHALDNVPGMTQHRPCKGDKEGCPYRRVDFDDEIMAEIEDMNLDEDAAYWAELYADEGGDPT